MARTAKRVRRARRTYKRGRSRVYKGRRMSSVRVRRIVFSIAEKKFIDVTMAGQSIGSAGVGITLGPNIALGTGTNQRIGRQVWLDYMEWMIDMNMVAGTATLVGDVCRCVIFKDRQNNSDAAVPSWANLYSSVTPYSLRDPNSKKRFKVISDQIFTFATLGISGANTSFASPSQTMRGSHPLKQKLTYVGTAGTPADLINDCWEMVAVSRSSAANTCSMSGVIRFWFRDM